MKCTPYTALPSDGIAEINGRISGMILGLRTAFTVKVVSRPKVLLKALGRVFDMQPRDNR